MFVLQTLITKILQSALDLVFADPRRRRPIRLSTNIPAQMRAACPTFERLLGIIWLRIAAARDVTVWRENEILDSEAQSQRAELELVILLWRAMMADEPGNRFNRGTLQPLLKAKDVVLPWSSCGATLTAPRLAHPSTCTPGDADGNLNLMKCGKVRLTGL